VHRQSSGSDVPSGDRQSAGDDSEQAAHQCRRLAAASRRALELLEASLDGCTEAIMLAHGFRIELLVELVRAGLATRTRRGRDQGHAARYAAQESAPAR